MFQSLGEVTLHNLSFIDVLNQTIEIHKDITFKQGIITKISIFQNSISSNGVDCTGLWAIPSLIDAHAHLSFNPYMTSDVSNNGAIYLNLTEATLSGVCLVRDLGVGEALSQNIREVQSQSQICFPEIVAAGTPICINTGHGADFGTCVNFDDIGDWMSMHHLQGYEWVKIMNDPENHSQVYLNEIVARAHEKALLVACHVFTPAGIESAIEAQVDTIEHSVPCTPRTFSKARNIFYVPTAYSAWISTQSEFLQSITEKEAQHLLNWNQLLKDWFGQAINQGFKLVTGTDGGCAPSSLHDIISEIKIFSHYGMGTMDSIKAATITAAQCLQREDLYGSITEGKYANIILLDSNPLDNINALDNRRAIFLRGTSVLNEVKFL